MDPSTPNESKPTMTPQTMATTIAIRLNDWIYHTRGFCLPVEAMTTIIEKAIAAGGDPSQHQPVPVRMLHTPEEMVGARILCLRPVGEAHQPLRRRFSLWRLIRKGRI